MALRREKICGTFNKGSSAKGARMSIDENTGSLPDVGKAPLIVDVDFVEEEENTASVSVLVKAGFVSNGRMFCYGEDSPCYRLTRSEWVEQQAAG